MELLLLFMFLMLLAIIVLLSVQLHLTKKQLQLWAGKEKELAKKPPISKDNDNLDKKEVDTCPDKKEEKSPETKEEKSPETKEEKSPETKEEDKSDKEKVLEAIDYRKKSIFGEDLPRVEADLSAYFSKYAISDYFKNLNSTDYYRFIDLRENPSSRVVVIGDIHGDFISLAAMLLKLSVSEFDYFRNAYFVFLGDYMDRGQVLFEPLLLLMDLKKILGERMIMLKGNHETLEWDETTLRLKPHVIPHDSCDCLNDNCGDEKEFLRDFAAFYSTLPTYVYLKTTDKNILLTHASVPRDIFLHTIKFDETNGAIAFSDNVPVSEQLTKRNQIFKDMIWGDPSPYEEKFQVNGRFEFGKKQFDQWVSRNHIDLMFRSHEEAAFGYTPFFNERLFTIFSTGGDKNPQTGYPNVEPAFAVIQNGRFFIENSFIYKVKKEEKTVCINLFTKLAYTEKQVANYKLDDEFACDKSVSRSVRSVFKAIQGDTSVEE